MRHVLHTNDSRHAGAVRERLHRKWVMSRLWMRHVPSLNQSRHAGAVPEHLAHKMSHVTHINALRLTYQCVASHISMRGVSHVNASRHTSAARHLFTSACLTYAWGTSHSVTSHSYARKRFVWETVKESCLPYECAMSHIRMSHVAEVPGGSGFVKSN